MWTIHLVEVFLAAALLLNFKKRFNSVSDFLERSSEIEKAGAAILAIAFFAGIALVIQDLVA